MFKRKKLCAWLTGKIYDFHLTPWIDDKNAIVPAVTLRRRYIKTLEVGGESYVEVQRPSDNATQLIALASVAKTEVYGD